jgi:uncharacterized protein YidB (DUF937 family)
MLDGVLGGVIGASMTSLVQNVLQKNGGVQGLMQKFETQGLGGVAQSWVSTGANQPVTPDQVHQALGAGTVADLAKSMGIDTQTLLAQLAEHLPTAVDTMTPNGKVA